VTELEKQMGLVRERCLGKAMLWGLELEKQMGLCLGKAMLWVVELEKQMSLVRER